MQESPAAPLPDPAMLAAWLAGPARVEPLPSAGFSGAPLFLVEAAAGRFVLKPFRPGTARERAGWVHGLMSAVGNAGVCEVPVPRTTASGTTLVAADGVFWELVPFVAGRATLRPAPEAIATAMGVLARFHRAARSFAAASLGPAAGIIRRIETFAALSQRPWSELRRLATGPLADRIERACDSFAAGGGSVVTKPAARWEAAPLRLQPVIRDVWSDHVLFDVRHPTRVAGIVDYHAAGTDTPATDVARLLGSWDPIPPTTADAWWSRAVQAYRDAGGDDVSVGLVRFLHASGVVCGLDNWFRWTVVEARRFSDPRRVLDRIDRLLGQLPACLSDLADRSPCPGLTRGNRNL